MNNIIGKQIVLPFLLTTIILGLMGILVSLIFGFESDFGVIGTAIMSGIYLLFISVCFVNGLLLFLIIVNTKIKEALISYGKKYPIILSFCSVSSLFVLLFLYEKSNMTFLDSEIVFTIIPIFIVIIDNAILYFIFKKLVRLE